MDLTQTVQVLRALAYGKNPLTGQELPRDSICHHPQVIRALFIAIEHLDPHAPTPPDDGDMGKILAKSMEKQADVARKRLRGKS
jgi:hypothetical protein